MIMVLSNKQRAKAKSRNIGLDAQAPANSCNDSKCPWHGMLPVRGRVFIGKVVAAKASKTAMVEWNFVRYLRKFQRYERRHSHVVAYNPACIAAKAGEMVKIAECRPLSNTKSFVVIERMEAKK